MSAASEFNNECERREATGMSEKEQEKLMNQCPHCHVKAKRVDCRKCTREMCAECISGGDLCGLCYDEERRLERSRSD